MDAKRAIEQLLEPTNYSAMHMRIDALNNRAVFEIPSILEQILGARLNSALPENDERTMPKDVCAG